MRQLVVFLALLLAVANATNPNVTLDAISLPPGFSISVYAENIPFARSMDISPAGIVYVAGYSFNGIDGDTKSFTYVYAVIDSNNDGTADFITPITGPLWVPNGIAFLNGDLYVALIDRVLKYPNVEGDLTTVATPVQILGPEVLPNNTWHGWRYLRAGQDGKLYMAIGSPCNVPGDQAPNCDYQVNEYYGTIVRFNTDGSGLEKVAHGVRNSVGMDWHPVTGDLWFTDNGRDNWDPGHNDRPPDELNHISNMTSPGQHFGFPFCFGIDLVDEQFNTWGSCTTPNMTGAVVELKAHGASLGMRFYSGSMFPSSYQNAVFIAEHGSWDRQPPSGFSVVAATLNQDMSFGTWSMFASGWTNNSHTCTTDSDCPGTSFCQNRNFQSIYKPPFYCSGWGRPADVQVLPDGSLLVSDEQNGVLYRISYSANTPWYDSASLLIAAPLAAAIVLTAIITCVIVVRSRAAKYGKVEDPINRGF